MDRWPFALIAGLLGGAAGGIAVDLVRGGGHAGASGESATVSRPDDLAERLDRIEAALAAPRSPPGALEGRPSPASSSAAGGAGPVSEEEALLRSIEARVLTAIDRKYLEQREQDAAAKAAEAEKATKKRRSLAEVAREMGISAREESEIRRIYDETNERILKLLADPDGDVEAIRRDLDPSRTQAERMVTAMKYLPKFVAKIGDFVALGAERDQKVSTLLGPDRSARYEGYDVREKEDPFDLGGSMRVEARTR